VEKDVVIIGSGGAGLAAAIVAAKRGLQVLVVEKTEYFGGATAMSGGGTWVPNNSLARAQGIADSVDEARVYVQKVVGDNLRVDVLDAFLQAAPAMLDFMQAETEVAFSVAPFAPDYHPDEPGAAQDGRMLSPVAYDGTKLGKWFGKLRPPLPEFNAPAGMMIDLPDMQHVLAPTSSVKSALHVAGMVGGVVRDRLRGFPRGTRLTMGNALAARLLRSAIDAGVELWENTPMTGLIREGGRITAVELQREGQKVRVDVRRGAVIASGGFSQNPEMRAKHIPYADQHISLMPPGNTGDGLLAATAIGAAMDSGNSQNAAWTVISLYPQRDGSVRRWPHLFLDRPKPGYIIVDSKGERFGDEASLDFVSAMHRAGAVPAHLVCDGAAIRKYGLGAVLPGGWRLGRLKKIGYIIEAPSLRELAAKIGCDPDGLERTVAKNNEYAKTGIDLDFGKGGNAFDRSIGDFAHQPNPCLGPIATGPFYAGKINPGDATTTLGLRVDDRARVLDEEGLPIPGLYACGLDMNSLWRGIPPANGANNTLSLTFGYIAGREIARAN
jgi:succinate dehydrogenase/fumarate reductase flavoprotein subunit